MSQDNTIKMECTKCKAANYRVHKNVKTIKQRLELQKFCKHCRAHTAHKETK
ncbi:MAG: 50S ribosomal protein L33 [Patescibacteria group bacterium]